MIMVVFGGGGVHWSWRFGRGGKGFTWEDVKKKNIRNFRGASSKKWVH